MSTQHQYWASHRTVREALASCWLLHTCFIYESLDGFFGYAPLEMVEELQAVLEGQAFSWYTRLERTIKMDWVALK
ncbi:hypothetical protein BC941DRAFT_473792 [Chlamydoabsidia padenii]|nr:hypothetical protein BC941DRAFT_473792 [Chlamydoabsidia padenii]